MNLQPNGVRNILLGCVENAKHDSAVLLTVSHAKRCSQLKLQR